MDVGLHALYYPAVMMAVSCQIGAWCLGPHAADMDRHASAHGSVAYHCLLEHTQRGKRYLCSTVYLGTSAFVHSFYTVHLTRNLEWVRCSWILEFRLPALLWQLLRTPPLVGLSLMCSTWYDHVAVEKKNDFHGQPMKPAYSSQFDCDAVNGQVTSPFAR